MTYKMTDVLNFIGNVTYVQFEDSCILYTTNDWLEEYGNIKVDVANVQHHHNGTNTLILKR